MHVLISILILQNFKSYLAVFFGNFYSLDGYIWDRTEGLWNVFWKASLYIHKPCVYAQLYVYHTHQLAYLLNWP